MNTRVYKEVHRLAKALMTAAQKKDQASFDGHYTKLKQLCELHDGSDKDHPVQWETLGDFTDDFDLAISIYDKALSKAKAKNAQEYMASIGYSVALLKVELGDTQAALVSLQQAKTNAQNIIDKDLKTEIQQLIKKLESA